MTGRVRSSGSRRALAGALAAVLLAGLCACRAPDGADNRGAALQRVLDGQATAVRNGDERRYLAAVATGSGGYRAAQRQVFRNLRRLPLAEWSYDVTSVTPVGKERARATVRLRYRLKGYDRTATADREKLHFTRERGKWRVAAEAAGSDRQLWEQGEMTVVRGKHGLVLGAGRSRSALRALARTVDAAVPAVDRSWPGDWGRKVVLVAPASVERMAELLDEPASSYEGIAAVTTGEAGEAGGGSDGSSGGGPRATPDRITVNPRAFTTLSPEGRQIVITHETVHVATRTRTTADTPLWLSEGLADWIGYRDSDRTPREAAPELARAVTSESAGEVLAALPSDADFRFGNTPDRLARAYEGAWLACRMTAERWGGQRLVDLYTRVGERRDTKNGEKSAGGKSSESGKSGDGSLDRAMRVTLGVSEARFTRLWRAYVKAELSGP